MLFEDNDFDINMAFFIPDVDFSRTLNVVSPMEGFLRGNMFKDEYEPYKNLTYFKLNPSNDKERLLYQVMAYSFAINDLNLYLDLHPDNKGMLDLFKKYVKEEKELCNEYVNKYGPLEVNEVKGQKFDWINSPWPWETRGGSMYV
ncbi:MAG TPA: spore coat protein CotJB [Candidatus Caccenecus avistercoris]|nr:spore coat protein CotJB [Candidatus Caccenecus avistercoris]